MEQRAAINQHHTTVISNHFRQAAARVKQNAQDLPLDQRLINHIVEGTQTGLIEDLELKLGQGAAPLDIINGPLMDGMTEVGRLFNRNELIVAEILQSAEAMKAAVDYVQGFMEKSDRATRGTVLLATVKGDVHDIGKNLVEIILSNNGYKVINLGQKVTPETLIAAYAEHKPDAVGLSGLLVKSTHQMAITAGDFKAAGIRVPLLVGGAALSETFTRTKIAEAYDGPVYYAKDAMAGLQLMNQIMDRQIVTPRPVPTVQASTPSLPRSPSHPAGAKPRAGLPIPAAPYLDRRVRDIPQLAEVWNYINPYMLFGRHLGYKADFEKNLRDREPKALALYHQMEELKRDAARFMRLRAVWQYFEAEPDGDEVGLFAPGALSPTHTFRFSRQQQPPGLSLSDYVLAPKDGKRDHVVLFAVTAGAGIQDQSEQWKLAGEFFKAHAILALAVETAEAGAEWLHRRIREEWGFPDPPSMTMQERFTSKYRGKRYSFGYPACPNLEDQQGVWKLLQPEEIGIQLTESMMMDPEASVSSLVFHHPDCAFFAVGGPASLPS
jgi:5-methyltetrahydrofolate--homocysteine methyltransferase